MKFEVLLYLDPNPIGEWLTMLLMTFCRREELCEAFLLCTALTEREHGKVPLGTHVMVRDMFA